MGFPQELINCIKTIYTNREFSLIFNGVLTTWNKASRGVTQGDPLSPYLFAFQIEPMCNMIREKSHSHGVDLGPRFPRSIFSGFADDSTPL